MGLAEYQNRIAAIRLEHKCTAQEAREIYKKEAGDATPKQKDSNKNRATKSKNETKGTDPETASAPSKKDLFEKATQLETFFLGNRQNASAMERTAKSFLGDGCTMHRSVLKPNECWFIAGDIRVPKEGVLIIKLK